MDRFREKGLSPERIVKILAKHGTKVDIEQAGLIKCFMERLALIALRDLMKNSKPQTSYFTYRKMG